MLLVVLSQQCEAVKYQLRYKASSKKYTVSSNPADGVVVATADYNATFNESGWDYLRLEGDAALVHGSYEERDRAFYAVGFLEGYLTQDRIVMSYSNGLLELNRSMARSPKLMKWLGDHRLFMKSVAKAAPVCGEYCARLSQLLQQIQGVADGYAAAKPSDQLVLTDYDIFFKNFIPELFDVLGALNEENLRAMVDSPLRYLRDHCSALIRVTRDDLFVGHDTWAQFHSMLRQYKTYAMDVEVAMSSYPGWICSGDDWYMTSNGLAITETTIDVPNATLYQLYTGVESVSEFLRSMIATYTAHDGASWVSNFSALNSGTYCNSWMVVDMKKFNPPTIGANTLWVAEQIPGTVESADMSDVLRTKGFWSSYNEAAFPNIRRLSGADEQERRMGSFFSLTETPRAKIFRREAPRVQDLNGMKRMMRYNNYKSDPFSLIPYCTGAVNDTCDPPYSAKLAIAARGDLQPPGDKSRYGVLYRYVGQSNHGATDSKITSWKMMKGGKAIKGVVINGPTYDDLPPFVWSKSPFCNVSHKGLPDRFDFIWQEY